MCLECHIGLADSIILEQLQKCLENPQYEKWDNASLNHVFLASIGYHGKDAQVVGNKLLCEYARWSTNNTVVIDVLKCSVRNQEQFLEEELCHEQIRQRVQKDTNVYRDYPVDDRPAAVPTMSLIEQDLKEFLQYGKNTLRAAWRYGSLLAEKLSIKMKELTELNEN